LSGADGDDVTAGEERRPHRPALFADLTEMIDSAGGTSPSSRAELAAATAAAVVRAGRSPGDDAQFVGLADRVGLDTLAALWRDAEPVSLPGALWALYLLRQWSRTNAEQVRLLWRAGAPLAPAEAAVAGVADDADAADVQAGADAILTGVYRGDLAVALERAAAAFRVLAAGRRDRADALDDADARVAECELAARNERAAADLATAARKWRAGTLD
jgi:hypothetical protein